jgi:transposase
MKRSTLPGRFMRPLLASNGYARRAGIESTISQSVRAFGARRSRYRGLAKTHLQHVMTAVAINVRRVMAWMDSIPKAKTRVSHFAALAA